MTTLSKKLRDNKVNCGDIVLLKTYCDLEVIREKIIRSVNNKSILYPEIKNEMEERIFLPIANQIIETISEISKFATNSSSLLFLGISKSISDINLGANGDTFTNCLHDNMTKELSIARSFAGIDGTIMFFQIADKKHFPLDISWLSAYPDEKQVLSGETKMRLIAYLPSRDYDQNVSEIIQLVESAINTPFYDHVFENSHSYAITKREVEKYHLLFFGYIRCSLSQLKICLGHDVSNLIWNYYDENKELYYYPSKEGIRFHVKRDVPIF